MNDVDTEQLRRERPEAFQAWQAGQVRPYYLTAVREHYGRDVIEADELFGSARLEAGFMYPPWTFLCRYAAWVGCDVGEFTHPSIPVELPAVTGPGMDDAFEDMFRVRYHPVIVHATMMNLNDRYGISSLAAFEATSDQATLTAARGIGAQLSEGIPAVEIVADLDAGRVPETRILRARWAESLAPIWDLIDGGPDAPLLAQGDAIAWMDSNLVLSFMATREASGDVMLSIAAHHDDHGRVPLPDGELVLWLPVLFDPDQLLAVTTHGAQSGYGRSDDPIPVLTTEYLTYTPHPPTRTGVEGTAA